MSVADPSTNPLVTRRRFAVVPTTAEHRVTVLELLFDLVFVFAITQVTQLMAGNPSARGLLRGLVLLMILWWVWCSYAWLGNQARADAGAVRAGVITAMSAMFLAALAMPRAWDAHVEGWSPALLLAGAIAVSRLVHLGVYAIAAGDDKGLRRQLTRTAVPVGIAAVLLVVGAIVGGAAQTAIWFAALVVDYVGIYVSDNDGWRLPAPAHFAERHGLIVLIALGESIVAIGVGISDLPLTGVVVLAALLGLAITTCLWWLYFGAAAEGAEHALKNGEGVVGTRLARDAYTYLHFPMVAGIIYLALGLKKVVEYVADRHHHALTDALSIVPVVALFGGVALYLAGHLAFRYRTTRTVCRAEAGGIAAVLGLALVSSSIPAIAALSALTVVLVAVVVYESSRSSTTAR